MSVQIGPHLIEIEEDCVMVRLRGSFTLEQMKEWCALGDTVIAEYGHIFTMSDFSGGGDFPPDSRRYAAQWQGSDKVWGAALFGGGFAQRVVVNLIVGATQFFQNKKPTVMSFATEPEARAWISETRRRKKAGR